MRQSTSSTSRAWAVAAVGLRTGVAIGGSLGIPAARAALALESAKQIGPVATYLELPFNASAPAAAAHRNESAASVDVALRA